MDKGPEKAKRGKRAPHTGCARAIERSGVCQWQTAESIVPAAAEPRGQMDEEDIDVNRW